MFIHQHKNWLIRITVYPYNTCPPDVCKSVNEPQKSCWAKKPDIRVLTEWFHFLKVQEELKKQQWQPPESTCFWIGCVGVRWVMGMLYFLIRDVMTQVHTTVSIHHTGHFRSVHFIIYKLHLIEGVKNKRNNW